MSSPFFRDLQPGIYERQIRSLSDSSNTPPAKVRALFNAELARLQMGAKVGSYLAVLTESSVRGMLRRKTKLAADLAANHERGRSGPPSVS